MSYKSNPIKRTKNKKSKKHKKMLRYKSKRGGSIIHHDTQDYSSIIAQNQQLIETLNKYKLELSDILFFKISTIRRNLVIVTKTKILLFVIDSKNKITYRDQQVLSKECELVKFLDTDILLLGYKNRGIQIHDLSTNRLSTIFKLPNELNSLKLEHDRFISLIQLNRDICYLGIGNTNNVTLFQISTHRQINNKPTIVNLNIQGTLYNNQKIRMVNNRVHSYLVCLVEYKGNYSFVFYNLKTNSIEYIHSTDEFTKKIFDFELILKNNSIYLANILAEGDYYSDGGLAIIEYDITAKDISGEINFGKEEQNVITLPYIKAQFISFSDKLLTLLVNHKQNVLLFVLDQPIEAETVSWKLYEVSKIIVGDLNNSHYRLDQLLNRLSISYNTKKHSSLIEAIQNYKTNKSGAFFYKLEHMIHHPSICEIQEEPIF